MEWGGWVTAAAGSSSLTLGPSGNSQVWVGGWGRVVQPPTPQATSQTLVVTKKSKEDLVWLLSS